MSSLLSILISAMGLAGAVVVKGAVERSGPKKRAWQPDLKRLCLTGIMGAGATQVISLFLILLPEDMQAAYGTAMGTGFPEITVSSLLLFLLAHIILAPVTEEVIFRGIAYGVLRNAWGSVPCILVTSVLFAITHGYWLQMVYALFSGLLLAVIREGYGSIFYTISFHVMFNLFGSGLVLPEWTVNFMVLGIALFGISVSLFLLDVKKNKKEI